MALTPPDRPASTRFAATSNPATEPAGTSIHVYSGCGAFALALQEAGLVNLAVNDYEWHAHQTLLGNNAVPHHAGARPASLHDPWLLFGNDLQNLDFSGEAGQVDVFSGSPDCQPWSVAGKHRGYEDRTRNGWPAFLKGVRQTGPKAVLAETVPGILDANFRPYFDYILRQLQAPFEARREDEDWTDHDRRLIQALQDRSADPAERYDVYYVQKNAANYGDRQIRERVMIVTFRKDLGLPPWMPPPETHSETALWYAQATGEYWRKHPGTGLRAELLPEFLPPEDGLEPWGTVADAIAEMPEPRALPDAGTDMEAEPDPSGWLHHYLRPGGKEYPGHRAHDLDRPAHTITTSYATSGVVRIGPEPESVRYLTIAEVKQLFGLPKWWWLAGSVHDQFRQLGNSFPLGMGRAFADSVVAMLRLSRGGLPPQHSSYGGGERLQPPGG